MSGGDVCEETRRERVREIPATEVFVRRRYDQDTYRQVKEWNGGNVEWFVGGRLSELLGEEFRALDAGGVVVGYDGDNTGANAADQGAKMLGSCLARGASDDYVVGIGTQIAFAIRRFGVFRCG